MAKSTTFQCSVVTPEKIILDTQATFVAFPAHDGEVGILPNRAPLVCRMGIGTLRIESPQGNHTFFVDGGFAQVVDNRLSLLTEQAKKQADIAAPAAEKALSEARSLPMVSEEAFTKRQKAVKRAQVQVKLARS